MDKTLHFSLRIIANSKNNIVIIADARISLLKFLKYLKPIIARIRKTSARTRLAYDMIIRSATCFLTIFAGMKNVVYVYKNIESKKSMKNMIVSLSLIIGFVLMSLSFSKNMKIIAKSISDGMK